MVEHWLKARSNLITNVSVNMSMLAMQCAMWLTLDISTQGRYAQSDRSLVFEGANSIQICLAECFSNPLSVRLTQDDFCC